MDLREIIVTILGLSVLAKIIWLLIKRRQWQDAKNHQEA